MCLMPFSRDPNPREHANYCSYCYCNGDFVYSGSDVKEFQRMSYQKMRESGMFMPLAWLFSWMIQFAPHWKKPARDS